MGRTVPSGDAAAPRHARLRVAPGAAALARRCGVSRLVVWVAGVGAVGAVGPRAARATSFDPSGLTRPFGALGDALVAPAARWDTRLVPGDRRRRLRRRRRARRSSRCTRCSCASAACSSARRSSPASLVSLALPRRRARRCCTGSSRSSSARDARAARCCSSRCSRWRSSSRPSTASRCSSLLSVGAVLRGADRALGVGGRARRRSRRRRAARASCCSCRSALLVVAGARPRRCARPAWLALVPPGSRRSACVAGASGGDDALAPFARAGGLVPRRSPGRSAACRDGASRRGTARASCCRARDAGVLQPRAATRSTSRATTSSCSLAASRSPRGGRRGAAAARSPTAPTRRARSRCRCRTRSAPQPLMSLPRFLAVLFPLFMWLGAVAVGAARGRAAGRVARARSRSGSPRVSARVRDVALGRVSARAPAARRARHAGRARAARAPRSCAELAARGVDGHARRRRARRCAPRSPTTAPTTTRRATPTGSPTLRARCTEVLRDALPRTALRRRRRCRTALLAALRFRPYPEVPRRARGAARARRARSSSSATGTSRCTSVLERTGLAPLVDGVVTSAEVGAAKPDPAIFAPRSSSPARGRARGAARRRRLEADVAGARAAGIEPVLVARDGAPAPPGVRAIPTLEGLLARDPRPVP